MILPVTWMEINKHIEETIEAKYTSILKVYRDLSNEKLQIISEITSKIKNYIHVTENANTAF